MKSKKLIQDMTDQELAELLHDLEFQRDSAIDSIAPLENEIFYRKYPECRPKYESNED